MSPSAPPGYGYANYYTQYKPTFKKLKVNLIDAPSKTDFLIQQIANWEVRLDIKKQKDR